MQLDPTKSHEYHVDDISSTSRHRISNEHTENMEAKLAYRPYLQTSLELEKAKEI